MPASPDIERLRQGFQITYMGCIAEVAKKLPEHEHFVHDLDNIRERLPFLIDTITKSDIAATRKIGKDLLRELHALKDWHPAIALRGRASIQISQASIDAFQASHLESIATHKNLWTEIHSNADISDNIKKAADNVESYFKTSINVSQNVFKQFTDQIKHTSQNAIKYHRSASREARFLVLARWLEGNLFWIAWSFLGLTLGLELLLVKQTEKFLDRLVTLVTPYYPNLSNSFVSRLLLVVIPALILGWIIHTYAEPYFHHLEQMLEKRSTKRLASDVLDLAFITRIYRVVVDASYRSAIQNAQESLPEINRAKLKAIMESDRRDEPVSLDYMPDWLGPAPRISQLTSLGTIPEIIDLFRISQAQQLL